ncbi:carbon-nitrogen hydrolase family protein [Sphingopyxis sp. SE2]|jgi:predicted amidohydrolase|uniref:carbon-nitrogen hydrolase family protein n=1 Tax=unclassified Sphingopyxis TaxID=2614943 RepID=UPI00051051F3|nr:MULTISPECIES: carbon-nitrogen hydrolase family protein [unclassified Sphingopyxis]KGB57805.1 Nitrilase/cyanide hydratase and apolipoprotein N-acyltransferase [Sphingopyxis sp. LC363]MDT7527307.1 carbon-nitrogen hydrolase family protein [Sphingopyxis sp. SE2]
MNASSPVPLAALIQMTSGIDPDANLATIDRALAEAAARGAAMAFLPEMSLLLDRDRTRSGGHIAREADSPWPSALQEMAQKHGVWLHSGSMPLLADDGERRVNRSHVIAADGGIRARYDKIHMFDVALPSGENWRESATYVGGDRLTIVDTPLGRMGLSICYDLRFPELYRALADRGATVIAIPAAFTVSTGEAHWHVLMRARAIETQCHVLAAAQCGTHVDGRQTYGHSVAIDPWGAILADANGEEAMAGKDYVLALAPVDAAASERARLAIPLERSRAMRNITP